MGTRSQSCESNAGRFILVCVTILEFLNAGYIVVYAYKMQSETQKSKKNPHGKETGTIIKAADEELNTSVARIQLGAVSQ